MAEPTLFRLLTCGNNHSCALSDPGSTVWISNKYSMRRYLPDRLHGGFVERDSPARRLRGNGREKTWVKQQSTPRSRNCAKRCHGCRRRQGAHHGWIRTPDRGRRSGPRRPVGTGKPRRTVPSGRAGAGECGVGLGCRVAAAVDDRSQQRGRRACGGRRVVLAEHARGREMGADLSRIALVADPGSDPLQIATVLLDGIDLRWSLGLDGMSVPPSRAKVLAARARRNSSVLLVVGGQWPGAAAHLSAQVSRYRTATPGGSDPAPGACGYGRIGGWTCRSRCVRAAARRAAHGCCWGTTMSRRTMALWAPLPAIAAATEQDLPPDTPIAVLCRESGRRLLSTRSARGHPPRHAQRGRRAVELPGTGRHPRRPRPRRAAVRADRHGGHRDPLDRGVAARLVRAPVVGDALLRLRGEPGRRRRRGGRRRVPRCRSGSPMRCSLRYSPPAGVPRRAGGDAGVLWRAADPGAGRRAQPRR